MQVSAASAALVLLLAAAMAGGAGAARILALFVIPGRSHFIVTSSLARALAEKGHEVTVVSPFTTAAPPPTYRDLLIPNTMDTAGTTDFYSLGDLPPAAMLLFLWKMGSESCRVILQSEPLQKLIKSSETFDLVIVEAFISECLLGFAHRFQAPIVQIAAFDGAPWMSDWVGNPTTPSYIPDPLLDFSDRMTLAQRAANAAMGLLTRVGRALYYTPRMDAAMREGFADPDMPHLADIERNTSVLLVNGHFSLAYPRPAVPAYVQVGGLHIPKPKALPQELGAWLGEEGKGFVYFSMGSNLRSADMPEAKREAFLRAFSALGAQGLRVLWKWEEAALPGKPRNVRVEKWLPQPDVLAHPKCLLFITHGGLMSTQEAVYHGVPVVGIPIFGDQQLNMARAAAAGFGVPLRFQDVTEETLSATLARVLGDASFRSAAKRLSAIFHDRPRPPMQEAVFWTEYVIRHRGARHLRSAAIELSWYQVLLLDIVALAAAVLLLVAAVAYYGLRFLCGRSAGAKALHAKKKRN